MSDLTAGLTSEEMADLCALADGTLPAERRAEVEARVAASPALQALLERQRRAVAAVRSLEADEAPESLRAAVERRTRGGGAVRRWKRGPRLAVAGVAVLAAAVLAAVLLSGGPGAPTLAEAAQLAARGPTAPAPSPAAQAPTRLAAALEGVSFPNLAPWSGWRAIGLRRDRLDDRPAAVVYYRKGARRIAYVIVGGPPLPRPGDATVTAIGAVEYRLLRVHGQLAVTWRRNGHTCVVIGRASRLELLRIASWPPGQTAR